MRSTLLAASVLLLGAPARADTSPRGPYLQALGPTSVEVRIELPAAAPASLEIEPKSADAGARRTVADPQAVTMHVFRVSGLAPATRYAYAVTSGTTTAKGELTTAPAREAREPFVFLVYGDNRTDDVGHASVVRALLQTPSDFVINTGDLVEDGSEDANWQAFFSIEAPFLRDRCVFAAIGNHELLDGAGASYLRYFGPTFDAHGDGEKPKLYGSFRWATARFFLLDAMESFDEGPERAWLDDELARADGEAGLEWRIVVMHHSPWSAGPHGANPRAIKAGLPELFARHRVDLVLAGHDHIYERGFASGVRYLISGGGGAPLYPVERPLRSTRKVESARHFLQVTVKPSAVDVVAQRDDGSRLDACSFNHGREDWACDPFSPPAAPAASQPAPPPAASRCACDVVGAHADSRSEGAVAAAAVAFVALGRRRRRDRG